MALDTLFFDLKINDMTDEQIKAIKSRLEKQLGANLDIGKQIQQSVNKGGGIKVKVGDLYDTTNRLADISAGLGGDMSRLVLAFSQVKAAAYLRGFDFMATLCGNTEDITPLIAGTPRKGQSAAKYAIAA
jgi:hypothetical protein